MIDETSAISESPCVEKPKSFNLDCRFGNRTLSSLAFPIFDFGSSCSRSMENRADSPLISKLVRKSSEDGNAVERSISGFGSGSGVFFPNLKVFDDLITGTDGASESVDALTTPSGTSFVFFFVRNRFIVISCTYYRRLEIISP